MRYDFVIIGGGVSGMSAALLLAGHGRSVALIEKSSTLAPLLSGFSRDGVHFDTGFHYSGGLGPGGILDMFLGYLGVEGLNYVPYDENGFDVLRFADSGMEFVMPYGQERVRDALCSAFPCERRAIDGFLAAMDRAVTSSLFLNPELPLDLTDLQAPPDRLTLKEYLDSLTDDPLLKTVLSVHTLLHGTPPEEVGLLHHGRIMGPYLRSVHSIVGGGPTLVEAFRNALRRRGVDVLLGCGVARILASGQRASGVVLDDGRAIDASGVVFTAHPHLLLDMVPEGAFRPAFRKRVRSIAESPSALMLFAVARERPAALKGRNIFALPGGTVSDNFRPVLPPGQRALYTTCGQTSSPKGYCGIVSIVAGFPCDVLSDGDTEAYHARKAELLEAMHRRLASLCPGLSDVKLVDGATPSTVRRWSNTPFGSMYGVRHSVAHYGLLPVTRLPGLYMAGQGIIAPGLLGAVISALVLGEIILGKDSVRGQLRKCA